MTRRRAISRPRSTTLLTLLAAVALFLQSLAIQTHIHPLPQVPAAGVTQAGNVPAPSPLMGQDPDQSGCRLCQELAHSGLFAMPAVSGLFTALIFVITTPVAWRFAGAVAAPPPAWQSRAPPRR